MRGCRLLVRKWTVQNMELGCRRCSWPQAASRHLRHTNEVLLFTKGQTKVRPRQTAACGGADEGRSLRGVPRPEGDPATPTSLLRPCYVPWWRRCDRKAPASLLAVRPQDPRPFAAQPDINFSQHMHKRTGASLCWVVRVRACPCVMHAPSQAGLPEPARWAMCGLCHMSAPVLG